MKLGILMDGGEESFLSAIKSALFDTHTIRTYLEIGVAYGETIVGVWEGTKHLDARKIYGIELPEWPSWNEIKMRVDGKPEIAVIAGRSTEVLAHWPFGKLSAVLIDACHGKPCVMADFLAVEPHVADGGIVMFHDAGRKEQGVDVQPHCNQPISVRLAIDELGLWTNERAGWEYAGMIPTANATAVFRKVKTQSSSPDNVAQ
jgi:hypothetical protein